MNEILSLFTTSVSESEPRQWFVWDMYAGLPPKIIFIGEMTGAHAVAEAKNRELASRPKQPLSMPKATRTG